MAIQGHVFWGQWKSDNGLMLALFPKVQKALKINVFDYPTVV